MSDAVSTMQVQQTRVTAVDNGHVLKNCDNDNLAAELAFEAMRSSPRKEYTCSQRIAPMHGDVLAQASDYVEVECNDISCGGISFFLRRAPVCNRYTIALGQKPSITTLIVEVANVKEVMRNNRKQYLVGCKFVGRAED